MIFMGLNLRAGKCVVLLVLSLLSFTLCQSRPIFADQKQPFSFDNLPSIRANEFVDRWRAAIPSVVNYGIFDAKHEELVLAGKAILLYGTFASRYPNISITDDQFELAIFEVLSDRGCNDPDIAFLLSNDYMLKVEFRTVDLIRSISWTLDKAQCQ